MLEYRNLIRVEGPELAFYVGLRGLNDHREPRRQRMSARGTPGSCDVRGHNEPDYYKPLSVIRV